jgi:hypothetical protein
MDGDFFTLQDFFQHTKSIIYIVIVLILFAIAGFWNFLTERDED